MIVARCEVCDVVSSTGDGNDKEANDLDSLSCEKIVPEDDVSRWICTSSEFGGWLANPRRKWSSKHYRYELTELEDDARSCLLRIVQALGA